MKNFLRKAMIALLICTVLTPSQAMAKSGTYDIDTSDYTLAVVGAGLVVGGLIYWAVRSVRKKGDAKAPATRKTANAKKPRVSLMLDVVNDPVSRTAATQLNLEPTYVVGAKIRF